MPLLTTLFDVARQQVGQHLTPELLELYDGDLQFPSGSAERPYILANFVSTLDGVVTYQVPGLSSGSAVSGSNPADRFVMGLLRASADAVLFGAHTLQDTGSQAVWTSGYIYPDARRLYADYRTRVLRKPENPLVVIVTASGTLDFERAAFRAPGVRTLVITTVSGESELVKRGVRSLPAVEVNVPDRLGSLLQPSAITRLLASQFGIRLLLHEGGPTLFGEFLAADLVDELFLTLSPRIAGRLPRSDRLGLLQGREFLPGEAPRFGLLGLKQKDGYLYLRYLLRSKSQDGA